MYEDLKNKKIGKLEIIDIYRKNNRTYCKCKCECGNVKEIRLDSLKNGHTKSCGCFQKEKVTKHKKINTRLYRIWHSMKDRCTNPNLKDYKNYGERGIKICPEWFNDFMCFYKWAILNGYNDNLSIDRKDTNGNYEPNNCRWATNFEQQQNKRTNINIEFEGEKHCLSEWARIKNINYYTLRNRIKRSWELKKALAC